MKGGNKQDETWINPFIKQFTNLSFSVSICGCCLSSGLGTMHRHWNALLPTVHFHRGVLFTCVCPPVSHPFSVHSHYKNSSLLMKSGFVTLPTCSSHSLMLFCIYLGVLVREPDLDWMAAGGRKCFKIVSDGLDFSFLHFWIIMCAGISLFYL